MIDLIENKLVDLIRNKLKEVTDNPLILKSVFRISDNEMDVLVNALNKKPFEVLKMYPLSSSNVPCIIVGLTGEEETSSGIGDQILDSEPQLENLEPLDIEVQVEDMEGTISFRHLDGVVYSISSAINNDIDYSHDIEILDEFSIRIPMLDEGDIVHISGMLQKDYNANIEVLYSTSYTIEVWTENADITVMMYHLLKWILLSSRQYLISLGLNTQKLSGGDFKPVPSFFPDFVYRRGITMKCQTFIAVPEHKANLVNNIVVL